MSTVGEPARTKSKAGPLLALANLVIATACGAIVIARDGYNEEALAACLRLLTPIGFLYFFAAFIARPLHDFVSNRATSWLLANRRYLGLSFAAWHLLHWPILGSFYYL